MQKREAAPPPPALFEHCLKAYKLLLQESELKVEEDGTEVAVWEGMFTAFITQRLHLSTPYFTSVRRELMRMGCILQIRRGGGSSPSRWILLREPTIELFEKGKLPRTAQSAGMRRLDSQQDQIDKLVARVLILEKALEGIIREEERARG